MATSLRDKASQYNQREAEAAKQAAAWLGGGRPRVEMPKPTERTMEEIEQAVIAAIRKSRAAK